jgi:hypothetical protein
VRVVGLLEGAHEGLGLGHEFLRHIQRCRTLIHVIDGSSRDPIGDFAAVQNELELFNPDLVDKPQVKHQHHAEPHKQKRKKTFLVECDGGDLLCSLSCSPALSLSLFPPLSLPLSLFVYVPVSGVLPQLISGWSLVMCSMQHSMTVSPQTLVGGINKDILEQPEL